MTAKDGWAPTVFEVAMGELGKTAAEDRFTHMEGVEGETWGAFGIARDRNDWVWVVTHLPTGRSVASFDKKADAKRFCRQIAGLTDWEKVTGQKRQPEPLRSAVRAAMERHGAVSLVRFL